MSKFANHLHKYKKLNIGKKKDYFVYKCLIPGCNRYIAISQSLNELCECNRCGNPMIIDKRVLAHSGGKPMLYPCCINCIKRKEKHANEIDALTEFLSKKV